MIDGVDGLSFDGSALVVEGEFEFELWSKELIGDQSDANSDDVVFICVESESESLESDSELESVFACGLACSALEVKSVSPCCPLAGVAEDDGDVACSGLTSMPTLISTQSFDHNANGEIVWLFQDKDFLWRSDCRVYCSDLYPNN
jgi:hypothetical protein